MALDTSIALGVRNPQFQTIDPMTIYQAMEGQRLNALRERALEQEMQRNALSMQYATEDRRAAAAQAAQARAQAEELKRLFQSGYQPAKNPVMGPGTVQGATPASFDFEGVKNNLGRMGRIDAFKTVSELQEQEAKRREAEAKATGQGFTNTKTQAETLGVLTDNQKKLADLADVELKRISTDIDRASSIEAVNMLYDANPNALAVTGKTPEQAKTLFAQRVAEVGFDRARMEVAQGVFATAKQLSDLATAQAGRTDVITGADGNAYLLDKSTGTVRMAGAPAAGAPAAGAPAAGAATPFRAAPTTEAQIKLAAQREALPAAIETAELTLKQLEDMVGSKNLGTEGNVPEHPGFQDAVGATYKPFARLIPGTNAANFVARFDQIEGGAFLKAYETLKGTGQITEKEGEKATSAISRMKLSQSEAEFNRAAQEFYGVVKNALERAKTKMGSQTAASATAPLTGTTSNGTTYTVETGKK
jgi:hypothetical protein